MSRNLDLALLRSYVAVVDAGGVTRGAARLNLTQSAVSMQLKRLETLIGRSLLDRSGRSVALTAEGEQMLGFARRLLALNDEAWGRMTGDAFEGEIELGVPHDLIYPHVPQILQRFSAEYPRIKVRLHSLFTRRLRAMLDDGRMDLILATEGGPGPGGEVLARDRLVWVGAEGGQAWRQRPLRVATLTHCIFLRTAIGALEAADIPWESGVDAISETAVDASVGADLAVHAQLPSALPKGCEVIDHAGRLPELPEYCITMYVASGPRSELAGKLAELIRQAWQGGSRMAGAA